MKLNELNTKRASELGILPAFARAERLLRLKAIMDEKPFDPERAQAAQESFIALSIDAREGLGQAWDRMSLAITFGWDIPDSTIADLAQKCAENMQKLPPLFT